MNNSIERIYELYSESGKAFTDSRQAKGGGVFFALKGDRFNGNEFALSALENGANYAVVDEPVDDTNPRIIRVDNALATLQELANHHRKQLSIPVLAITGTNGKTTTKELITAVLRQKFKVLATAGNLNNHIGVPLTLLSISKSHNFAVIEMGANHQGEIAFLCSIAEPNFGIITNVGKAHLEGFGSFEGVKKTKGELYNFISEKGEAIFINADNKYLNEMSAKNRVKYTYGILSEELQLRGDIASEGIYLTVKALFPKGWLYVKTNLSGAYNLENVLAAARIGLYFDIDPLLIKKGIEAYKPENNRSQVVQKAGAVFMVDCYNANPTSMEASIMHFDSIEKPGKVFVLGDMLELGNDSEKEHQFLIDKLAGLKYEAVFLVGKCFTETQSDFRKFKTVEELLQHIEPGFWNGKFVLLKGSRGIKLEKLLDSIE